MKVYSLYEAKARFSEILRRVRERGETVIVSYHGKPAAEIRPVERGGSALDTRLRELESRGVIVRQTRRGSLSAVARRRGALERFLAERDGERGE